MDRNSQRSYLEAALRGQRMQRPAPRAAAPVTPRASPSDESVPYCTVPLDIKIDELYRCFGRFGYILDMHLKRIPLRHTQKVNVFYNNLTSKQRLLRASPVLIDGWPVVVELKMPFPYYLQEQR